MKINELASNKVGLQSRGERRERARLHTSCTPTHLYLGLHTLLFIVFSSKQNISISLSSTSMYPNVYHTR